MKKLIFLFSIIIISITSCSVYEDIYFSENGTVKYNMTIDAGELLSIAGQSSLKGTESLSKDSTISFAQIIKDTLLNIPPEMEQDLRNIEPLNMRMESNDSLGILKLSFFGDFDNIEAMNKAFISMAKMEDEIKKSGNRSLNKFSPNNLFNNSSYVWDGTKFSRILNIQEEEVILSGEESDDDPDKKLDKSVDESLARLFSQGQMVVRYHFPKKIKSVSNENATFSMDGKNSNIPLSGKPFPYAG